MPATENGTVLAADGTTIAYDLGGIGPAVIFVHGLTASRARWDPVTRLLDRDLTCVRIDLRGHGASSIADDYGMPALAGDVRAVVDALGLEAPAIVGHSLGANVAAIHAAVHGASSVVCVDSGLRFGDFAAFLAPYAERLRGADTLETLVEIEHAIGLGAYAGVPELEERVRGFSRETVLGAWRAVLTQPPQELTAIAEAVLPRITAPLLSLHGSEPAPDYRTWLTGLVPCARLETWDGLGHMLHLVEPERFAARVLSWLSGR